MNEILNQCRSPGNSRVGICHTELGAGETSRRLRHSELQQASPAEAEADGGDTFCLTIEFVDEESSV